MPKPALRIGVLTLRPGDEAQLEAGPLATELNALIAQGALNYPAAPDDWIPFNDGTTILSHLAAGLDSFQLSSGSVNLTDFRTRLGIKLFVIDPAVLLHPVKMRLAILIQEHVCCRKDAASCVVIRGSLPVQFVADMSTYYQDKLTDLMTNANGALFEYQVDNLFRLQQFLRRVGPILGNVPDSQRRAEAIQVLAGVTGSILPSFGMPTIGIGA